MMYPASCSAVVRPASPITKAVPPDSCECRKSAVASADVQMLASGTSRPERRSRALRSRGMKIGLFVSTRKGVPLSRHCASSSLAPGMGRFSWTRTPSMSVSQHSMSARVRMGPAYPAPSGRNLERVARHDWDPQLLPDLHGRTYLVTGANAGLGYFSTEQLAAAGAHVLMT